jgi:undecaprenyl-diphosphatase
MNIFWAAFMGIIQGLTEFFPVSSSAHLTLAPWVFNFPDPGLSFDIALHAGTFFAILIALWLDWKVMVRALLLKKPSFEKKMIIFLITTSIPGAIFGYLLESKAETIFRAPLLIAATLAVFGLILFLVDKYLPDRDEIKKMTYEKSFLIGLSQALAIIPGVSRSGATITAGRILGFNRETAVKYSFLAALPIIFGASVFGLRKVPFSDLLSIPWLVGFLAALISSIFAMKFLLRYVKKNNFNFVWYRLAISALIVILIITRT